MAYKFQLGAAILSGTLKQEGAGEFDDNLTIGSAVMSEQDLEKLDDITNGTGAANKALVLDGSRDIANINRLTAAELGAFQAQGAIDFNNQAMTNVNIDSGAIDGTAIGANSASTAVFTTISGSGAATLASLHCDSVDIDGGAIDGTVIGASSAAAGTFTAIVGTSLDINGVGDISDTLTLSKGSGNGLVVTANSDLNGDVDIAGTLTGVAATFSGVLTANGDVDLGNATSDTITATGRFDSDLVPSTDSARSLGSSALQWSAIHVDVANIDQLGVALDANGKAITNINVDSGAIDGAVIGANSAAAGTFTTINGTTINASSAFSGSLSGSLIQGTMANFGGGGISTSDGGSIGCEGDISGSGDFAMGGTVQLDGVADATAAVSADSFYFFDVTDDLMKKESMVDYAASIAGDALGASSGVLAVKVDSSSIEVNSDALRVKALGVTNAMLAGSITNAKLVNDSVTLTAGAGMAAIGSVDLGASITVAVDGVLEDLDTLGAASADGEFIVATGAGAFAYESGNTARTSLGLGTGDSPTFTGATLTSLTASHARITNLDVVTINSIAQTEETLEVSDKLIVSALSASSANSADGGLRIGGGAHSAGHASVLWDHANSALDFNIQVGGSEVTQIRLADGVLRPETDNDVDLGASGAEFKDLYIDGTAYLDAINFNGTAISATAAEINILDAGAGSALSLQDADSVLFFDNSVGDVVKKTTVAKLKDHVQNTTVQNIANGGDLVRGFNYFSAAGAAVSASLPQEASVGHVVQIKAASDCSSTNFVKITKNSSTSHTIDGLSEIILESPNSAVSCMYVGSNLWKIF